jgi:sarcosine oxidase gamma subunit
VSELAFLSLDATAPAGLVRPLARSPLTRRLREAGAEFEERDGWLVAVRVPGGEERRLAIRDVTHVLAGHDWGTVPGTVPPLAGLAALEIEGSGATTVLRRISELELDTLPAVGAVAHVRAWLFRTGEEAYRLVFEQEYGHYLWEVVVDAAEPLGGGPAGTP